MAHDGKIVGLFGTSNGRACEQHQCCGGSVVADNLIHFKSGVVVLDGALASEGDINVMETVIKAIFVKDGMATCTTGFLPRHIMARGTMAIDRFMGKFAQIIKLYYLCDNSMVKNKSSRNQGMALFPWLNDIQERG